jgi:hypothetical protein
MIYSKTEVNRIICKRGQICNIHGNEVIKFAPCMCYLHAIELPWAKHINLITLNNVSRDKNMNRLKELVLGATLQVSKEDWEGFYRHVEKLVKNTR